MTGANPLVVLTSMTLQVEVAHGCIIEMSLIGPLNRDGLFKQIIESNLIRVQQSIRKFESFYHQLLVTTNCLKKVFLISFK